MADQPKPIDQRSTAPLTPCFSTEWERADYEREKRGKPPLGPFGRSIQATDRTIVTGAMTPDPQSIAGGMRGFAAFMRSGFDLGDVEMVAKKFEAAADEIERLRGIVERLREKVDAETRAVVQAQIETCDARRENRKILGLPS